MKCGIFIGTEAIKVLDGRKLSNITHWLKEDEICDTNGIVDICCTYICTLKLRDYSIGHNYQVEENVILRDSC